MAKWFGFSFAKNTKDRRDAEIDRLKIEIKDLENKAKELAYSLGVSRNIQDHLRVKLRNRERLGAESLDYDKNAVAGISFETAMNNAGVAELLLREGRKVSFAAAVSVVLNRELRRLLTSSQTTS